MKTYLIIILSCYHYLFLYCLPGQTVVDGVVVDDVTVNNETYMDLLTDLSKKLLKNYDRNAIPIRNVTSHIDVYIHNTLTHIEEISQEASGQLKDGLCRFQNEQEQTITLHTMMHLGWTDNKIEWDLDNYGGITHQIIPSWVLWMPRMYFLNSGRPTKDSLVKWVPMRVDANGNVNGVFYVQYKVTCFFDYSDFPYDVQKCPMVIGAGYPYGQLHLGLYSSRPAKVNYWDDFVPQTREHLKKDKGATTTKKRYSGWELIDFTEKLTYFIQRKGFFTELKEDMKLGYYDQQFYNGWLTIRRRCLNFHVSITLPSIAASVLTCLALWMSSLRVSIGMVLSSLVVQVYATKTLLSIIPPAAGKLPNIMIYFGVNLSMTCAVVAILLVQKYLRQNIDSSLSDSLLNTLLQKIDGDIDSGSAKCGYACKAAVILLYLSFIMAFILF